MRDGTKCHSDQLQKGKKRLFSAHIHRDLARCHFGAFFDSTIHRFEKMLMQQENMKLNPEKGKYHCLFYMEKIVFSKFKYSGLVYIIFYNK